jgi:hypothetical protein
MKKPFAFKYKHFLKEETKKTLRMKKKKNLKISLEIITPFDN